MKSHRGKKTKTKTTCTSQDSVRCPRSLEASQSPARRGDGGGWMSPQRSGLKTERQSFPRGLEFAVTSTRARHETALPAGWPCPPRPSHLAGGRRRVSAGATRGRGPRLLHCRPRPCSIPITSASCGAVTRSVFPTPPSRAHIPEVSPWEFTLMAVFRHQPSRRSEASRERP